jgi:NO-binding membrane sensor protein with MHYT domain
MGEDARGDGVARWVVLTAGVAAAALVIARFVDYIRFVDDVDVEFQQALAWWSTLVIAVSLTAGGLLARLQEEDRSTEAWLAFLVGLLILVAMPAAPGFNLNFNFGGFGGFGMVGLFTGL